MQSQTAAVAAEQRQHRPLSPPSRPLVTHHACVQVFVRRLTVGVRLRLRLHLTELIGMAAIAG